MALTPERWQQVARIYEQAAELPPHAREAYLADACGTDEELRTECESLLRQDAQRVLLDGSVWATAGPLFDDAATLEPGALLGRYRIERLIGSGGMGEVFRATDTRLHRTVAIKVLPAAAAVDQQLRVRFAREARAVAALAHPHICTLYDVGRQEELDFLVMEHLDGQTLATRLAAGALPYGEALQFALQTADALDHAHRHGIVHRDLKPANIMLTAAGVKLLDFGLAKFRSDVAAASAEGEITRVTTGPVEWTGGVARPPEPEDSQVTRHGAVLGTARYMGPEQLASGDVDARTDLFAFGSVLFEMLTGRSAFEGDDAAAIRAALLGADPPPVSSLAPAVPPALDAIVARCLAKDPAARWQTAGDLVAALKKVALQDEARARSGRGHADRSVWKRWGLGIAAAALASVMVWTWSGRPGARPARPAAHIRSLAVLPLENLSGDPEHDYFADGMTEQLIADLAKIHGLRVTARTSVMHYRDARKPAPEIARELQVDGIVEGSMARAGGRARVTARLADATGAIVWTGSFERDVRDVLTLQSEVARSIVSQIDVALTPQDQARLSAERAIDPEVHRLVLLGRHHAAKATESSLHTAIQFFESAIAADSGNAFAHAGLAEAYNALNGFYMAPEIAMPKAKRAAETAVRLDDGLADAHAELGYVHLVYDWDGAGAERELLRALDLNPTHAPARLSYAAYLSSQGRCDGAREQVGRAVQLDPLSIRTHAFGTLFLLFCRRYEEAIALANRGLELEPTAGFVLAFQGVAYGELRRFDEAIANFQKAVTFDRSLTIRAMQAHILAIAGRVDEARAVLRQVEQEARTRYFCPYEIGTVHVSLGDRDAAYQWFRKGTDERADCMPWLGIEPWLDPFRTDPRYRTLVQEIGLTPLDR